jgi:crotonobetainyl-CoA:carnitine CoA-transferase CaiB-like acyl-CoA transferase
LGITGPSEGSASEGQFLSSVTYLHFPIFKWHFSAAGAEPCKPGVAMTDMMTGLFAHGAILAALFQREKTGKGQQIHCNLLATQLAALINIGSNFLNADVVGNLIIIMPTLPYSNQNFPFSLRSSPWHRAREYCAISGISDKGWPLLCCRRWQ